MTIKCADCGCYPEDCKDSDSHKYAQIAHEKYVVAGFVYTTPINKRG